VYKRFALLCLVVTLLAGIALAGAVKIDLMPYPVGNPIEPDASGKAVLNYAEKGDGKTEVQVNCWGLVGEAEYTVYITDASGAYVPLCTFTTNKIGSGSCHGKIDGDLTGSTVAVNNSSNLTVLLGP